ncbi:hypothetical protein L6164_014819 [Bauhinia variegata]|uniref:Uncharacterized protein n=1 Tax=Bauhinia variegata TaxID=167791 RepID=A0ACB9NKI4_BAUVA|nr:hypothetical protein L6164_014819 [Bauhinia variegata]
MAVSYLSSFLSTLLSSKSAAPCLHRSSLQSQILLRQNLSEWPSLSLVISGDPTSPFSSGHANDISPIVNPVLAHSNILYFKSTYNVQVIVGDNEPEESLINRFRREVLKAGVLQECKRRRFFENGREKKKRKAREAARRNRKRKPQPRAPAQNNLEAPTKKKDNVEDDNWELPDVDIPYC